ncbi:twin-arginine translocation pathway signal protein [uncultured Shimia sp.]|uniref:Acg family FMN-binding oxidoreductase n=1 Tax=uncultured Shimia sp. TaxID=573152 RepID=UPI002607FEE0|nr:twin-arginine translocation pathway signal protein [uncultured Shimia sp.]
MNITRRKTLALIGGGVITAAAATGFTVTRRPNQAIAPWALAGTYADPRKKALSFALLAPNPHNRQPWMVDLSKDNQVTLFADLEKMLPETDPLNRQITIGLGCFLEVMRIAAAQEGYRVDLTLFPEGQDDSHLDARPIAHAVFTKDASQKPDPLFHHVMARRSNKEPFDTTRVVDPSALAQLSESIDPGVQFGGSVDAEDIAELRELTHTALQIEVETPNTYQESVDLFRIGHREVNANPDGIDFSGPLFESLHLTGMFTRETATDTSSTAYKAGLDAVFANTDTAMGHIWLATETNTRVDQIIAGQNWVRVNLATTALGLGLQPLSQVLQEYPEMDSAYHTIHNRLAPNGGTVQMLGRIGYGPRVAPSPRWPLEAKLAQT